MNLLSFFFLLDESNYTLVDPESEDLFGFKLKRSLQRAQTRQVCKVSKYWSCIDCLFSIMEKLRFKFSRNIESNENEEGFFVGVSLGRQDSH